MNFSRREGPWHFREGSVGGDVRAVALAEFFVSHNGVKHKP
jgi:hypothetical protein